MRMPDCRTDDYYSVENLDEQDRAELNGFDWCAEEVVDNFFNNDMFDLADPETYLGHVLCEEVPELMRERYRMDLTPLVAESRKSARLSPMRI